MSDQLVQQHLDILEINGCFHQLLFFLRTAMLAFGLFLFLNHFGFLAFLGKVVVFFSWHFDGASLRELDGQVLRVHPLVHLQTFVLFVFVAVLLLLLGVCRF
jgi:hypothetical protein